MPGRVDLGRWRTHRAEKRVFSGGRRSRVGAGRGPARKSKVEPPHGGPWWLAQECGLEPVDREEPPGALRVKSPGPGAGGLGGHGQKTRPCPSEAGVCRQGERPREPATDGSSRPRFSECASSKEPGVLLAHQTARLPLDQDSGGNTMATKWFLCLGFLGLPHPPLQQLVSIIGQTKPVPRRPRRGRGRRPSSATRASTRPRPHGTFHPIRAVGVQSKEAHVVKGALI